MTAAAVMVRCYALGIDLAAGPDGALTWEADADPPAELLADLAKHKVEVLAMLSDRLAAFCREIEAEQDLPAGSVFYWRPAADCPGCDFCRPNHRRDPIRREL